MVKPVLSLLHLFQGALHVLHEKTQARQLLLRAALVPSSPSLGLNCSRKIWGNTEFMIRVLQVFVIAKTNCQKNRGFVGQTASCPAFTLQQRAPPCSKRANILGPRPGLQSLMRHKDRNLAKSSEQRMLVSFSGT